MTLFDHIERYNYQERELEHFVPQVLIFYRFQMQILSLFLKGYQELKIIQVLANLLSLLVHQGLLSFSFLLLSREFMV